MLRRATVVFCIGAMVGTAFGHADDPKALDRTPRYEGPGWRAGLRGEPPSFPSLGITLASWVSLDDFTPASLKANSCWGYVSPSGREYAIIGLWEGTGFVEITDPFNPVIVSIQPGPTSLWREMKTYQQYCYSVSEGGNGIQVFNLTQIDQGIVTFVREVTSGGGTTATHTVNIDTTSGFLYRCGGGSHGLRIYSLSNPSNPVYVGAFNEYYVHEVQVVTYTSGPYAGKQVAFACDGSGTSGFGDPALDILDVTNKSNIVRLSRVRYEARSYSHQGWLSPDRRFFYLDDELDEMQENIGTNMRVFDVRDLSNPAQVAGVANGNSAIDHNLYTHSSLVYCANYRSGLRVFDASDPKRPVEVAYFDTFPNNDLPEFSGMWSNHPYFPSGTVIASDMQRGLFVFRVDSLPIAFYFPNERPTFVPTGGGSIELDIHNVNGGVLDTATPTLHFKRDFVWETAALVPLGGSRYRADFPATACGRYISYYVSATSTSGVTRTSPPSGVSAPYKVYVTAPPVTLRSDDMETNPGWSTSVVDDDASPEGRWTRVNPVGTWAQPENDHTAGGGAVCYVTGQGSPGADQMDSDVDGGKTTLTTPVLDLSAADDPWVSYWRWYSTGTGERASTDVFEVGVSNDFGANWTTVAAIGPGGENSGGWRFHEFRIGDFVPHTAGVQVRFVASDPAPASIVEAAIDDFLLVDRPCGGCPEDLTGDRIIDLNDVAILLANYGKPFDASPEEGDIDNDDDIDLADLSAMLAYYGGFCP